MSAWTGRGVNPHSYGSSAINPFEKSGAVFAGTFWGADTRYFRVSAFEKSESQVFLSIFKSMMKKKLGNVYLASTF